MNIPDLTSVFIFYLPLISSIVSDWDYLKKASRMSKSGYIYSILLPPLFIYIALDTFGIFKYLISDNLISILSISTTVMAYLLSNKIYSSRITRLKIKKGSEQWVMNRFYRDIFYSVFLAFPGSLTFLSLNLNFFMR